MTSHSLSIRYHPTEVSGILQKMESYCQQLKLDVSFCFQSRVVVAEALNNIIQHAPENDSGGIIRVNFGFANDNMTITLVYWSEAFEPPIAPECPETTALSGRGWPIINAYMDDIFYHHCDGMNTLILKKRYFPSPAHYNC